LRNTAVHAQSCWARGTASISLLVLANRCNSALQLTLTRQRDDFFADSECLSAALTPRRTLLFKLPN